MNADLVLNFAVDFCYLNSKAARAPVVEKLFRAPRMAVELLPYYSLLVAILSKVFDDIAEPLETLLCGEFRGLQNKKDVAFNRRESKIRNARFIGELIKFRVLAPKIAFYVRRLSSLTPSLTHSLTPSLKHRYFDFVFRIFVTRIF